MFVSDCSLNGIKIKKNYLQDIEALINNPNYVKKYYYLINSLKYKYKLKNNMSCKLMKKDLDECLFEVGFQIITINLLLYGNFLSIKGIT